MTSEIDRLTETIGRWWEDSRQAGLHRLTAVTSPSFEPSPWLHDLAGPWDFALVGSPLGAPAGWTEGRAAGGDERAGWTTVQVPGCWTRQGVGDDPHYTNIVMPFGGDPPAVPSDNPTGLYRTTFTRPRGWASRRTILYIGGAESVAAVWCNGRFVGTMTDSRSPSEFDLTPHVTAGRNTLAIMVIRWSAATWIEDQDHWFHAGLHRRILLRSVPTTALADVRVTAGLDDDLTTGHLRVAVRVEGPRADLRVETVLETLGGRRVRGTDRSAPVSRFDDASHIRAMIDAQRHPGPLASTEASVGAVRPWSGEDPHRYAVRVRLVDADGAVLDERRIVTGFRRVEVVGDELRLNGRAVLIAGVNRHDHHPVTGKTMTDAELRADVLAVKRAGFNALRTAHYPPDPLLLDTCDEIGLWVICEANLETHARWSEIVHDARFETAFVERVQRMVATHWNHPSIIGWSLGNEAGDGPAHHAAAAWVRAADPSRFVQYEGGVMWRYRGDFDAQWSAAATDIECPMYPPVADLERWSKESGRDKPLIMCEYSHAMGNSNGNLADYWAAIERLPGLQGGFIWDWRDQAMLEVDADGTEYYAYGGVFGDEPNDSSFCCNGMVGPDGTPHPAVEEHRWLTRPVRCRLVGTRTDPQIEVRNHRNFTDLSDLVGRVRIEVDGREVASWRLDRLDVGPGDTTVVSLPGDAVRAARERVGREAFVTITWTQRRATAWAAAGHVVAWDQLELPVPTPRRAAPVGRSSAAPIAVTVDADTGLLTGLRLADQHHGRELLASPPQLAIWRAPIDNDGVLVGPLGRRVGATRTWLRWGLDQLVRSTVDVRTDGAVTVADHRWTSPTGLVIEHRQRIEVLDDAVRFDEEVLVPDEIDDLPRIGVTFAVAPELSSLRWFGRGPWETASDRRAAPVGVWNSTVADQFVPYVTPQHHGTHVDTRWFELTDTSGTGVRVEVDGLAFDVSQYSAAQLTAAGTINELRPSGVNHVHVDALLRGVGTGACGPDTTELVRAGRHRFSWTLSAAGRVVTSGSDPDVTTQSSGMSRATRLPTRSTTSARGACTADS